MHATNLTAACGPSDPSVRLITPISSSSGNVFIFPYPLSYASVWDLQTRLHCDRMSNCRPDTVLLLEHEPVFTMGRGTQRSHWGGNEAALRMNGTDLYRVNRGGSVTYHGPGQILFYPIVRLIHHAAGPRQLVSMLEEVAIRVLNLWSIEGYRIEKQPGVWASTPEPAKIASIGIRVERGVTLHGMALNVDMDLTPFRLIRPCGIADCRITSMAALRQATFSVNDIKSALAQMFREIFGLTWPIHSVDANPHNLYETIEKTASAYSAID